MLGRRGFLSLLGGASAGLLLNDNGTIWTPGKLISIPKPQLRMVSIIELSQLYQQSDNRMMSNYMDMVIHKDCFAASWPYGINHD